MNIDAWKTLRMYTNLLENVMINKNTRPLFKQKWSPLLRDLLTTVQCHPANM